MKVYLSPYRHHWYSPYIIMEKVIFWRKIDYDEPFIKRCNDILSPISTLILKVLDTIHPKIDYVKIDGHDTWNVDGTLAKIILPLLIQYKKNKTGVPSDFTHTGGEDYDYQSCFDFYKTNGELSTQAAQEWDIILDKMIFSFSHLIDDDWESEFCTGSFDNSIQLGDPGWTGSYTCDYVAINKVHEQTQEGLNLFGQYFRYLWD